MRIPFVDKFPVDVMVIQKRGKGFTAYYDKARYYTKKDKSYYELKKNKRAKFKPISYDYLVPQSNGRPLAVIYEYMRDMYVPVNIREIEKGDNTKLGLKSIDEDMAFWGQQFRLEAEKRYKVQGFFEKYRDLIFFSMTFIMYVILVYFFINAISDIGFDVVNALNSLKGSAPVG